MYSPLPRDELPTMAMRRRHSWNCCWS